MGMARSPRASVVSSPSHHRSQAAITPTLLQPPCEELRTAPAHISRATGQVPASSSGHQPIEQLVLGGRTSRPPEAHIYLLTVQKCCK